jgi:hypothetical protein
MIIIIFLCIICMFHQSYLVVFLFFRVDCLICTYQGILQAQFELFALHRVEQSLGDFTVDGHITQHHASLIRAHVCKRIAANQCRHRDSEIRREVFFFLFIRRIYQ